MRKIPKFIYGWKLYVDYGQGWEYEVFETSWREAMKRRAEYRANVPQYNIKITNGRETNPEYVPEQ